MNKDLFFKVSKIVLILSLFVVGFILLLFGNPKPIVLGYIFGASISILSFYLLNDSASKLIRMEPSRAKRRAYLNYTVRFLIYFIVLFISAIADYLNIFATFVGLTMVKNAIYALTVFDKNFFK